MGCLEFKVHPLAFSVCGVTFSSESTRSFKFWLCCPSQVNKETRERSLPFQSPTALKCDNIYEFFFSLNLMTFKAVLLMSKRDCIAKSAKKC